MSCAVAVAAKRRALVAFLRNTTEMDVLAAAAAPGEQEREPPNAFGGLLDCALSALEAALQDRGADPAACARAAGGVELLVSHKLSAAPAPVFNPNRYSVVLDPGADTGAGAAMRAAARACLAAAPLNAPAHVAEQATQAPPAAALFLGVEWHAPGQAQHGSTARFYWESPATDHISSWEWPLAPEPGQPAPAAAVRNYTATALSDRLCDPALAARGNPLFSAAAFAAAGLATTRCWVVRRGGEPAAVSKVDLRLRPTRLSALHAALVVPASLRHSPFIGQDAANAARLVSRARWPFS